MGRLVVILALLAALCPGLARAAPTITKIASATQAAGSTTLNIITTVSSANGNSILLVFSASGNTAISAVSDSAGNAYVGGNIVLNGARLRLYRVDRAKVLPSGSTISFTFTQTANDKLLLVYTIAGASFNQDGVGATGTGGSPSFTGSAFTMPSPLQAIVVGANTITAGAAKTVTEDPAFTTLDDLNSTSKLHTAYQVTSSASAPTYAPTNNSAFTWTDNIDVFVQPGPCGYGPLMGAGC